MAGDADRFEVYRDKRGEYRWRRFGPDGAIVGAASEGYRSKKDCEANMRRGAVATDKWEIYQDKRGKYRWRRMAANGKVIGAASSGFATRQRCAENAKRHGYAP